MSRRILISTLLIIINLSTLIGQGYNHQWLLGYYPFNYDKARIYFDSSSYTLQTELRKMPFEATQANICDNNGNFLMSSNGVWIANATGDTMQNGSGLNPSSVTVANPDGLLLPYANLILPFPSDTSKYILFHHTYFDNGVTVSAYEIMQTIIDMKLDSGLGGVTIKNDTILKDTLNWGFGACKHANGRDWWIVVQKESSDVIFKFLLTPNGIQSVTSQSLNVPFAYSNASHLDFSPDGNKFAYSVYYPPIRDEKMLLFDFDRCTGIFSNPNVIPVTTHSYLYGQAFSANSKLLYTCSSNYIFQIDVNALTVDTVATFDGFSSIIQGLYTTFMNMYLAANGKIYITTGNGTQHIHEMNYPDSAGVACDVQQHAIFLNAWNFRAVPNHPNYYLGPVIGSVCDTLVHVGLQQHENEVQNFKLSPNPSKDGLIKIIYLLPQNKQGIFEVYDLNGKIVYTNTLSPWSSLQYFYLSFLESGLYQCVIRSGKSIATQKLMIVKN